jgi:hypothetical protein
MTYYCFPNYAIAWSRVKTYLDNKPQIIVIKTNVDITRHVSKTTFFRYAQSQYI